MAESFFDLSKADQREALEYARAQSGRPAHLLEKDIWVVWVLHALFDSRLTDDLRRLDSHLLALKMKLNLRTLTETVLFDKHLGHGHHERAACFA